VLGEVRGTFFAGKFFTGQFFAGRFFAGRFSLDKFFTGGGRFFAGELFAWIIPRRRIFRSKKNSPEAENSSPEHSSPR
jgi:hypothetical protein